MLYPFESIRVRTRRVEQASRRISGRRRASICRINAWLRTDPDTLVEHQKIGGNKTIHQCGKAQGPYKYGQVRGLVVTVVSVRQRRTRPRARTAADLGKNETPRIFGTMSGQGRRRPTDGLRPLRPPQAGPHPPSRAAAASTAGAGGWSWRSTPPDEVACSLAACAWSSSAAPILGLVGWRLVLHRRRHRASSSDRRPGDGPARRDRRSACYLVVSLLGWNPVGPHNAPASPGRLDERARLTRQLRFRVEGSRGSRTGHDPRSRHHQRRPRHERSERSALRGPPSVGATTPPSPGPSPSATPIPPASWAASRSPRTSWAACGSGRPTGPRPTSSSRPTSLEPGQTEPLIRQLVDEADVVHLNNSYRAAQRFQVRKPMLLHHHGSMFRNDPAKMLGIARGYRMLQAVSTIDLTAPGTRAPPLVAHRRTTSTSSRPSARPYRREPDGRVRVVHCPTSRETKHTQVLLAAVQHLLAEGLPIDLVLVEGRPWRESLDGQGRRRHRLRPARSTATAATASRPGPWASPSSAGPTHGPSPP